MNVTIITPDGMLFSKLFSNEHEYFTLLLTSVRGNAEKAIAIGMNRVCLLKRPKCIKHRGSKLFHFQHFRTKRQAPSARDNIPEKHER